MEGVKVGKYIYSKSNRKGKKLMTVVNNKTIHFGDISMEHFKDKTNIFKGLNHNDIKRRESYRARAKGIKDKNGISWNNPMSANYHSYHILW